MAVVHAELHLGLILLLVEHRRILYAIDFVLVPGLLMIANYRAHRLTVELVRLDEWHVSLIAGNVVDAIFLFGRRRLGQAFVASVPGDPLVDAADVDVFHTHFVLRRLPLEDADGLVLWRIHVTLFRGRKIIRI